MQKSALTSWHLAGPRPFCPLCCGHFWLSRPRLVHVPGAVQGQLEQGENSEPRGCWGCRGPRGPSGAPVPPGSVPLGFSGCWAAHPRCLFFHLYFVGVTLVCMHACSVTQSSLTLCDPKDCSPPGSSVHGILQARILEWVAIAFSKGSSWPRDQTRSPALQMDPLLLSHQRKSRVSFKCTNLFFYFCIPYSMLTPKILVSILNIHLITSIFPTPTLSLLGTTILFSVSMCLFWFGLAYSFILFWLFVFEIPHMSETMGNLSFSIWLISLSIIP